MSRELARSLPCQDMKIYWHYLDLGSMRKGAAYSRYLEEEVVTHTDTNPSPNPTMMSSNLKAELRSHTY